MGQAFQVAPAMRARGTVLGLIRLALERAAFIQGARGYIPPWALLSAGAVHITNNMAKDVNNNMRGWDSWFDGFGCVCYLLRKGDLRQRLVGRLVLGA
eukprot:1124685-Pyramimonas_sp.AAC.1